MAARYGLRIGVCSICGGHSDDVGPISARGKCGQCGTLRAAANIVDLRLHGGYFFRHWRRRMAASVGGVLLDELEPAAENAEPTESEE